MNITYPYEMVDMGGIDLVDVRGNTYPGLFNRILSGVNSCGVVILYNWYLAKMPIAPEHITVEVLEDAIVLNGLIIVNSTDTVEIPSMGRMPILTQLEVIENGVYIPQEGVDGFDSVEVSVNPPLEEISITENGTYSPTTGKYGFSKVSVDVSGTGVLVGTTDPTDDIGENGDYYYKRGFPNIDACEFGFLNTSGTSRSGYEFIATENSIVVALRGYSRINTVGSLVLAEGDGTVIIQIDNISFEAGKWNYVYLSNSIQLISGNHYIVQMIATSNSLSYASKNSSSFNYVTFVCGRHGNLPGTADVSNVYCADVVIRETTDYVIVKSQYYKENSHWEQIG